MARVVGIIRINRRQLQGGLLAVAAFIVVAGSVAIAQEPVILSLKATHLMVAHGAPIGFEAVVSPGPEAQLIYKWILLDETTEEVPGVLVGDGPTTTLDTSLVAPGRYFVAVHVYQDLDNPPVEASTYIEVGPKQ